MLPRTPGYCTLIARSRPSSAIARCTCPIDAAAIGVGANRLNRRRQSAPHSRASTFCSCCGGMWLARSRSPAISWLSSGGSMSPASIEIIWPSFIAAPRRCDSRSASRTKLPGVISMPRTLGRSPSASRRAPSAIIPPATPPASRPNWPSRDNRPLGTARSGGGFNGGMGIFSCPAYGERSRL